MMNSVCLKLFNIFCDVVCGVMNHTQLLCSLFQELCIKKMHNFTCTVHRVYYTALSVQCAVHSVQCADRGVQCIV